MVAVIDVREMEGDGGGWKALVGMGSRGVGSG